MRYLQFVVVMLRYIISLRLTRYIALHYVIVYIKFHFVTISFLCVMSHSHFNSFAIIAFHVSNLFFLFVLAGGVSTSLHLIDFKKAFMAIRKNLWPLERTHIHTKEFEAIRKNSWSYERIHGRTKEFVAIQNNSSPYERIHSHANEFMDIRDNSWHHINTRQGLYQVHD